MVVDMDEALNEYNLRILIKNKDYSALVSYLSSISGNPNYQITRNEIDLFSDQFDYQEELVTAFALSFHAD